MKYMGSLKLEKRKKISLMLSSNMIMIELQDML